MMYRVLFGFMRGERGDVIEVPDYDAGMLLDAGLIERLSDTAEARETAAVTPEIKEGENAPDPARPGRKRSDSPNG